MARWFWHRFAFALPVAAICVAAPLAVAQTAAAPTGGNDARWELVAAPYTQHLHDGEKHKYVFLAGLERYRPDGSLWGGVGFRNSFGQPSAYAYYGHVWNNLLHQRGLYFKLTGGVLYGYKGKYKDKVPFNHGGFAPAIVPGIGWRFTDRDAAQVILLGGSALMFSYNRRF